MVSFGKKVLFVGYGSVAQCTLPILVKHLHVPLANITVMDFEDQAGLLKEWTAQGVNFVRDKITPENMGSVIAKYLGAGDILIDLAWNIDCCEIVQWCHDRGVLYLNTSVEVWDPYDRELYAHPTQRTLVLATYERAADEGRLERGRPDGGDRARRQSGPDFALHQARPARHRRAHARRQESDRRRGRRDQATSWRIAPSISWR